MTLESKILLRVRALILTGPTAFVVQLRGYSVPFNTKLLCTFLVFRTVVILVFRTMVKINEETAHANTASEVSLYFRKDVWLISVVFVTKF